MEAPKFIKIQAPKWIVENIAPKWIVKNIAPGRIVVYYDSLPSSTTAPIDESSLGSFRFSDLQPRMHKTELRSNAKLTFVLM